VKNKLLLSAYSEIPIRTERIHEHKNLVHCPIKQEGYKCILSRQGDNISIFSYDACTFYAYCPLSEYLSAHSPNTPSDLDLVVSLHIFDETKNVIEPFLTFTEDGLERANQHFIELTL